MRSNNISFYLIIKFVFLCIKSRSYIKITILVLSTYFYLFFTFFNHLYFFLMFLSSYSKCKKINNFHISQILVYYYLLTFYILKNINIFICIGSTFLSLKNKKYSKHKFAVFILLLI